MSDPIKQLQSHTIETGSPFPFTVETVHDITSADPPPLTIATDGNQYRIAETDGDQATPNALRNIIKEIAPELTEYTIPEIQDEQTPETP